jgi:hypothetical protein
MNDAIASLIPPDRRESWRWWEARRLRYNLFLATAGWTAYALFWLLQFGFDQAPVDDWRGAVSMTLFLGTGFLVLMGIANILYLLGVLTESIARPRDVDAFRDCTWTLGLWGSVALPFLFPLATLAILLATSGRP